MSTRLPASLNALLAGLILMGSMAPTASPPASPVLAATPTTSAVAAGDRRDVTEPSAPDVVAVRLSPTPDAAAFLSGPLTVREGEVLLVDAGVVLYASRNPADYQVDDHPACGTISKKGVGQHGVRD